MASYRGGHSENTQLPLATNRPAEASSASDVGAVSVPAKSDVPELRLNTPAPVILTERSATMMWPAASATAEAKTAFERAGAVAVVATTAKPAEAVGDGRRYTALAAVSTTSSSPEAASTDTRPGVKDFGRAATPDDWLSKANGGAVPPGATAAKKPDPPGAALEITRGGCRRERDAGWEERVRKLAG